MTEEGKWTVLGVTFLIFLSVSISCFSGCEKRRYELRPKYHRTDICVTIQGGEKTTPDTLIISGAR